MTRPLGTRARSRDVDELRGNWRGRAACLDEDPELFFPVGSGRLALAQVAAAKAICARCPVIDRCRESALANGYEGVWGGLDDDERRRLRRPVIDASRATAEPCVDVGPLEPPDAGGDPGIPKQLRGELLAELASARRAIDHGDLSATTRVDDAATALGERGEPWWEPSTADGRRTRLAAAMRALLRHRPAEATICPSDAARVVFGVSGREAMEQSRSVAEALRVAGVLRITQRGQPIELAAATGPIRLGRGPKWRG